VNERSERKEPLQPVRLIPVSLEGIRKSQENDKKVELEDFMSHQEKVFSENEYFTVAKDLFAIRDFEDDPEKLRVYMGGHYSFFRTVTGEADLRGVKVPTIDRFALVHFFSDAIHDKKAKEDFTKSIKIIMDDTRVNEPKISDELLVHTSNFLPAFDEELARRLFYFHQAEPHYYSEVLLKDFRKRLPQEDYRIFSMGATDGHYLFEAYYNKENQPISK